jgi:hypothetical protein
MGAATRSRRWSFGRAGAGPVAVGVTSASTWLVLLEGRAEPRRHAPSQPLRAQIACGGRDRPQLQQAAGSGAELVGVPVQQLLVHGGALAEADHPVAGVGSSSAPSSRTSVVCAPAPRSTATACEVAAWVRASARSSRGSRTRPSRASLSRAQPSGLCRPSGPAPPGRPARSANSRAASATRLVCTPTVSMVQAGLLRCTEPRRTTASATLRFQMASASSSNATASRRLADSSTASS